MHIAVVIPVYNEAKHIGKLIREIPLAISGHSVQVVVVNDGSNDQTRREVQDCIAELPHIKLASHKTNLGKGAAAKTGCDAACKMGADIIVLMDGDGQHKPVDLERLIQPLLLEPKTAGLVIGVRRQRNTMPFAMRLGNLILTVTARMLFGINVGDTQSGFRAFTRVTYPKIRWASAKYAMETEMLILAVSQLVPIHQVEVKTVYLDHYKGTTAIDGMRILRTLLKWRLLWSYQFKRLEKYSVDGVTV